MNSMRHFLPVLMTLFLALPTSRAAEIPKELDTEIRRLLDLTGAANLGLSVTKSLLDSLKTSTPGVPEEFWKEFEKEIKPQEMVELVVPIYAKHLTLEEIRAANAYYSTPLGQSLVKKLPVITGDALQAGQKWGEQIGQRALNKLKDRGLLPK